MNSYKTTNINSEWEGDNCQYFGNFKKALCWYKKALMKDPENVVLLIKEGNTLEILHKYTNAYECYIKALLNADKYELIDNFVEKCYFPQEGDVLNLLNFLRLYNIPITLNGLKLVLKKEREARDIYHKFKEWQDFRKILERKQQLPIEEYVKLFLQRYGKYFYKYFARFYCYISSEKSFYITKRQLIDIILNQKKRIENDQVEEIIRTGRKKKSLSHLKGINFEEYLAELFEKKGFMVRKTPPSYDFGADLIITKFGENTAVQIKFKKQAVGITAIQEVHGARDYYYTQRAMVISLGGFSSSAIKMANRLGVELWNRTKLLEQIANL